MCRTLFFFTIYHITYHITDDSHDSNNMNNSTNSTTNAGRGGRGGRGGHNDTGKNVCLKRPYYFICLL